MREFLQKQKIGSPSFFLMHKIRGCGAWNDCFILMFCAMSNSKQEVLTQPQRIELELALRYLVIADLLPYELYEQVLDGIDFSIVGNQIHFSGVYGNLCSIEISEEDVSELKSRKS